MAKIDLDIQAFGIILEAGNKGWFLQMEEKSENWVENIWEKNGKKIILTVLLWRR